MRLTRALKITGIVIGVLVVVVVAGGLDLYRRLHSDPFTPLYAENCAVCHGEAFEGAAQGPALLGRALTHGDSVAQLSVSIANGFPERGMPAWSGSLNEAQIKSLAILIAEKRVSRNFTDFKVDKKLAIPA